MTFPFLCVFIAYALIWLPRGVAFAAQAKQPEGYDNKNPRDQQARLEGWGRRAQAAHNNTIEAFAPFAASVVVAHLAHANPTHQNVLAGTFVVARVIYPFLYIGNIDKARSLIWTVGLLATCGLFLCGYLA